MVLFSLTASLLLLSTAVEGKPILNSRAEARAKHAEHLFKRQAGPDYFSTHASSPNLVWYDCYIGLKCARLEVPLDYGHLVPGDVFKLALVKIPAKTSPLKGTMFVMNGLSSSVDWVSQEIDANHSPLGSIYQDFVDPAFDIISWDVRGLGHTTPKLQCFANAAAQSAYAAVERQGIQLSETNGTHLPTQANILSNIQTVSNHQKLLGPGCKQYYGKYLPYIGSADNARDLFKIVSLIGGTLQKRMLFYGYQTVLGTTYASMHPNSFDRMILDGVVNTAKLYLTGDNGVSNVANAQKGAQMIFDSCSAAGPCAPADYYSGTCCPFWASTPAGVSARYEALKGKYWKTTYKSNPPNPVCITCETSYYRIATALADPIGLGSFWLELFTNNLREWEQGFSESGGANEFFSGFNPDLTFDPYMPAVMSLDQTLSSYPLLAAQDLYLLSMNGTSNQMGGIIATQELYTANWPIGPKLKNPYVAPIGGFTQGKMLFVGNVASSQYPYQNAKLMSALFPGSGTVTVNALGDNTFFNGDSPCLDNYRQAFFDTGAIPPLNAFCNDIQFGLFGRPYVKDYR